MKYLWPKLWNTVIPEKNAITLPAWANNNLNSPSTDVTKTRNGEPGTGNGEQESGNERSAVFHIKIQNGGRENSPEEKRTTQVAKSTVNLS